MSLTPNEQSTYHYHNAFAHYLVYNFQLQPSLESWPQLMSQLTTIILMHRQCRTTPLLWLSGHACLWNLGSVLRRDFL